MTRGRLPHHQCGRCSEIPGPSSLSPPCLLSSAPGTSPHGDACIPTAAGFATCEPQHSTLGSTARAQPSVSPVVFVHGSSADEQCVIHVPTFERDQTDAQLADPTPQEYTSRANRAVVFTPQMPAAASHLADAERERLGISALEWGARGQQSVCLDAAVAGGLPAGCRERGLGLQPAAASAAIACSRGDDASQREAVLQMVRDLSAQRHVVHERFMLMNRALRAGAQGCVQAAVDRARGRERTVVKSFFKHSDFLAEASLYTHSEVQKQRIVPSCFSIGAWSQARACLCQQLGYLLRSHFME